MNTHVIDVREHFARDGRRSLDTSPTRTVVLAYLPFDQTYQVLLIGDKRGRHGQRRNPGDLVRLQLTLHRGSIEHSNCHGVGRSLRHLEPVLLAGQRTFRANVHGVPGAQVQRKVDRHGTVTVDRYPGGNWMAVFGRLHIHQSH
ncbi:hypothetical protein D3C75_917440 [compost metagenome]